MLEISGCFFGLVVVFLFSLAIGALIGSAYVVTEDVMAKAYVLKDGELTRLKADLGDTQAALNVLRQENDRLERDRKRYRDRLRNK